MSHAHVVCDVCGAPSLGPKGQRFRMFSDVRRCAFAVANGFKKVESGTPPLPPSSKPYIFNRNCLHLNPLGNHQKTLLRCICHRFFNYPCTARSDLLSFKPLPHLGGGGLC
uniref:Uncharacterized protein n=1 Tax=Eutreptiella gymnastica TaxID=73025 RepID=A0A7S4D0N1_9EUGL